MRLSEAATCSVGFSLSRPPNVLTSMTSAVKYISRSLQRRPPTSRVRVIKLICAPSHCKTIEFRKVVGNGVVTTLLFGNVWNVF